MDSNAETVRDWFDALNRRDITGLLGLMSADVHFAPGRTGTSKVYRGHDEVRHFFADADEWLGRPDSTIVVEDVHPVANARTVTAGRTLDADGEFVAVHDFADDGLISAAQLYMGADIETLRELGMI